MPLLVEQDGASFHGHQATAGRAVAGSATFGAVGGVGVLSAQGSKPFDCAVFPDGALHQSDITGERMAARAQVDVMRFSALGAGSRTQQGWPGSCVAQIDRSMASCSSANSTTQGSPPRVPPGLPGYSPCAWGL
jgi:hypothetical protein